MEDVIKNVKENENKSKNQKGEEKQLLKPKNDIVFQSLFNQKNEKITKAFIEDLLEEKIEIAKKLKAKGMNKEEISEITKLTIKEIEEI